MRRVLSALVLAVLFLALPAPAPAKGPTHMLLMSPTGGVSPGGSGAYEFMELSDSRAQEIEELLGDLGEKVTEPEYEQWHEVQVAWTMHAFDIFRSDIVFVDGEGAAVVMTVRSHLEGEGFSTDWRRVKDGKALTALFREMGLVGDGAKPSADKSAKDTSPAVTTKAAPATPAATAEADSSSGWFSQDGWGWTLPGVLAGLVLGVFGAPMLRRRVPQVVAQRFARS